MNPFQNVNFQSVNEFLHYLPEEELVMVELLRELTLECIPGVKEKLAYNVPFYYRYSRICFIWPGSVPWGKNTKPGVEFGFCKGHLLSDPGYLNKGTRKEVYIKTFFTPKEIDRPALRQLLYEAVLIDEETRKSKNVKYKM
ncbi:DUF1801 domain-containing protein [Paraflavisolibacter sp. H34]|uniref:DUF1801 domain-containing protein n=1 Tax=Huijunlia imazamoxiresistens TaxID=3127457 RepID=UPI0030167EE2